MSEMMKEYEDPRPSGIGLLQRLQEETETLHNLITKLEERVKPVSRSTDSAETNPERVSENQLDQLIMTIGHANRRIGYIIDEIQL